MSDMSVSPLPVKVFGGLMYRFDRAACHGMTSEISHARVSSRDFLLLKQGVQTQQKLMVSDDLIDIFHEDISFCLLSVGPARVFDEGVLGIRVCVFLPGLSDTELTTLVVGKTQF